MSATIVLMRHGQSEWNRKNLFTGWVDIPLSEEGIRESLEGGNAFRDIPIDVAFTSSLIRAHMTLTFAMLHHTSGAIPCFLHPGQGKLESWAKVYSAEAEKQLLPVYPAWELNERMYGRLQGLNKAETAAQYGAEQVHLWRRSYDIAPPEGESLKMTAERAIPYFQRSIIPHLERGKNVLVVAHGNSLRAIVMHIRKLSPAEVLKLELATGAPLLFRYERGAWLT
jgi:2,3-bisphosphoglycerate-dependent phosphoglycerate mutase